jgi:mono/diheme cytochrome c family protein
MLLKTPPLPRYSRALAAPILVLLCGCGGQRQHESTLQRGRAVFAAACTSCHTLTGRNSRAPGGDLATGRFSVPDIESFVRIMPVHLSPADEHAVAVYVHARMRPGAGY